ncbi:hypothetical protein SEA_BANTAM_41 [Gordonia phage Bantam]|uniref:Uncharacterized protein n=1 Tax=Gordonia phage Bantam TaxID=1887641 RepID=A0A1B3AYB2_9CAUD|nr:virion structural protein [Gordonia phage Bantam]AOE43731.1 hypothetical protein SEA_BANTAM_41 [Gordonia phage Bantam]
MPLNLMVGGQMTEHVPKIVNPNTGQLVDPEQLAIWDGTKFVRVWPPAQQGVAYTDPLDSLAAFTQTSTGSGVVISNGEAAWTGSNNGEATVLYNQAAQTDDQYVRGTVGSNTRNDRASGLIMHCGATLDSWYGVLVESDRLTLVSGYGRWLQDTLPTYGQYTGSVSTGDVIELWNKGTTFYVTQNGTTRLSVPIPGIAFSADRRRQGFGMYRTAFFSSGRWADWAGGDAKAFGK